MDAVFETKTLHERVLLSTCCSVALGATQPPSCGACIAVRARAAPRVYTRLGATRGTTPRARAPAASRARAYGPCSLIMSASTLFGTSWCAFMGLRVMGDVAPVARCASMQLRSQV